VFATAWRILGHAADAQDVVQEVFLQAYQVQQEEPVRCWEALLRRLAARRALDCLRRRRWIVPLSRRFPARPGHDPAAVALEQELAGRLRQAIAQLPHREASVFCLRCFDDLSHEQIAVILQTSVGAVATALHRARTRIEGLLLEAAQEK